MQLLGIPAALFPDPQSRYLERVGGYQVTMPGVNSCQGADLDVLLDLGALGHLADAALLDRFEARGPGADRAFEVLVNRHGPLVLRVARGRLAAEADARDVFQATFWLLARRSRSIRNRAALASWLFGVARRVAARALVEAARRRTRERQAAITEADSTLDPRHRDPDLAATVQAEVARLPRLYRVAVILADLEGLTAAEAADQLGCPVGTFKARLSRGRARLRDRLARCGLAPAGWESSPTRPSVVPLALVQTTCRLALDAVADAGLAATAASILPLTRGVSRTMIFASISPWALVASTSMVAGAVGLVGLMLGGPPAPAPILPPSAIVVASPKLVGSPREPVTTPPPPTQEPVTPSPSVLAAASQPPQPPHPGPALLGVAGPVIHQIDADAAVLTDLDARARLLLRLGRWQTRQGDRVAARATLAKAQTAAAASPFDSDGSLPRTIFQVGEAQAENGDTEIARQTFDAVIPTIRRLPVDRMGEAYALLLAAERRTLPRAACQPTVDAYGMFAAYQGVHLVRTVLSWGGRSESTGGSVEGGVINLGYGTPKLAEATRATLGDIPRALRRIDEVWVTTEPTGQPDGRLEALTEIAQALRPEDGPLIAEVIGKVRQAIRAAGPTAEIAPCQLVLMDTATRLGRFDEAAALALQIVPNSNSEHHSESLLAHCLMELIRAQTAAGDPAGARKLIRETAVLIQSVGRLGIQQQTLIIQFVPLVARLGDLDLAIDLTASLPLYPRYVALAAVLRDRRAVGDQVGAQQIRDQALAVIRQAIETREGATLNDPDGSRVSWLIRRAGMTGDSADIQAARAGVDTFRAAMQQRYFPSLAVALVHAGQFAAAIEVAERVTAADKQGQALLKVLTIELDRVRPATVATSPHYWPWLELDH